MIEYLIAIYQVPTFPFNYFMIAFTYNYLLFFTCIKLTEFYLLALHLLLVWFQIWC